MDSAGLEKFVGGIAPVFVITGTSADDMTEKLLWKACEKAAIPCFAVLDQWINYGVRFSSYGLADLALYEKSPSHDYLPTFILVMDELAKTEAIGNGLPADKILVTGSPYFETLIARREQISEKEIKTARTSLGIDKETMITFASEPISKVYKENDDSSHFWGYTERTILRELITSLNEQNKTGRLNAATLVVRLHPKQDDSELADIAREVESEFLRIVFERKMDSTLLVAASDVICGISSMFLIEAFIMAKPVLSIQIGLSKSNPFVLNRAGLLKSITSQQELSERLNGALNANGSDFPKYEIIPHASRNIIAQMERVLCRN